MPGNPFTIYDGPSVIRQQGQMTGGGDSVGGVSVSGTPSVGQVPTATSATTATWQAGGGGSQTVVRGPLSFAFNTAGLANGVTVYTPTVNDLLLDAWIEIDTAFDGTTPKGDIGTFVGTTSGLFASVSALVDISHADVETAGTGVRVNLVTSAAMSLVMAPLVFGSAARPAPARFTATNPLLLVVSQDGTKGGAAIGGTAGAGRLYIVTATPVAFT